MKRSPLSRVENMIRRVVEEPFNWLGGGSLDPFQLATHLTRFYDDPGVDGKELNRFTIYINPKDYSELEASLPGLERQVADYVMLMAGRRGYHLFEPPKIHFVARSQETRRSAHVVATHEAERPQVDTAVFTFEAGDITQKAILEADGFLIIQGRQHISLDRAITRIGRRIDNDIVLDSPSISRQHAQIRWRQRYFVLYDVSSHGRTSVNGMQAQEHILRPGDVIALSDILLVYGEGREEILGTPIPGEHSEMDSTMLKPEE